MSPEAEVGPGLHADPGVALGYAPTLPVPERLALGHHARLRSGSVIYSGSSIGARFETGHNVSILPFVRIGAEELVGRGAAVTRDLPERCVAFGNPAVLRCSLVALAPIDTRVEAARGSAARYRLARGTS